MVRDTKHGDVMAAMQYRLQVQFLTIALIVTLAIVTIAVIRIGLLRSLTIVILTF